MDFMSRNKARTNIVIGAAAISMLSLSLLPALAQEQPQQEQPASNTANRRIAMVLPKAPAQVAKPIPVTVKLNGQPVSRLDPESEFGSHARRPMQSKDNEVKAAIVDGASKAERLSRSYNHHVANLIVWLASSMQDSKTFSPQNNPLLRPYRPIEPKQPPMPANQIFLID